MQIQRETKTSGRKVGIQNDRKRWVRNKSKDKRSKSKNENNNKRKKNNSDKGSRKIRLPKRKKNEMNQLK